MSQNETTTTSEETTAKAAPAKKTAPKKVPVKAAAPAKKAAAPKKAAEPKVSKGDEWLPKILKHLAKNPDGLTRAALCEHFDVSGFNGALVDNPELIEVQTVDGVRGRVFTLTKKGKAQAAKA